MKVLKISGKNLNSLKGVWSIDFTASEYVSDGIFSITGATGAGKSTILDALALALFGRTPRLKNISKSTNEIMSRQTGECFAEAEIETSKGRFRFSWNQAKARNRADGNLQSQKREVAQLDSGKILADTINTADNIVIELTGLTYEQFSRSILLAQGDFAAFLKAGENERSEILEQITGTKIYSEISIKAHEKQKEESEKLKLLEAEIKGIQILKDEDVAALKGDLKVKEEENVAMKVKAENYSKVKTLLENIKNNRTELDEINKLLPQKKKALENNSKLKDEKLLTLKSAKDDQETQQILFKNVRSLDQSISEKNKNIKGLEEDSNSKEKLLKTKNDEHKKEKEKKEKLIVKIDTLKKYFEMNDTDEKLVSELSGLKEKVEKFFEIVKNIDDISKSLTSFTKDLEKKKNEISNSEKEHEKTKKAEGLIKTEIEELNKQSKELLKGETLGSYRKIKEGLLREVKLIEKILSHEEERKKLQNGAPCPLCGSKDHPFAEGNVPQKDETEQAIEKLEKLISKVEDIELKLNNKRELSQKAVLDIKTAESNISGLKKDKTSIESKISDINKNIAKLSSDSERIEDELSSHFEQLKIADSSRISFGDNLATLEKRKNEWVSNLKENDVVKNTLSEIDLKLSGLSSEIKSMEEAIAELKKKVREEKTVLEDLNKKRSDLFGTRTVDEEENKLKAAVNKLEEDLKKVSDIVVKATDEFNKDITKQELLLKITDESQTELEKIKLALPPETYPGNDSIEELSEKLEYIRVELEKNGELIGATKEKLKSNEKARKESALKQEKIEIQRKELEKWHLLDKLIGSADGKKFRTFAQGLTFEIMVRHANAKLLEMTDRYFLKRDGESPLELNIIDNYKAGDIRSTKNLSGGESFIVSLALALGLSSLSSNNIRIDSLFLDEGFGTLDEETLETALNILAGLHKDGKLIGVISHVSAMKERIATHISVVKVRDGNSYIEGPGVEFNP
ncbi:MAG TPA: AAA family ATPase [bacterium]|nr:AAA family ATPase [bacterium]HQM85630.1 AAA family ATPase [bacterium]